MTIKIKPPRAHVIASIRKYYNLTITDMAEHLGVTKGFISHLENGRYALTLQVIQKYADFLKVPSYVLICVFEAVEGIISPEEEEKVLPASMKQFLAYMEQQHKADSLRLSEGESK